eukprot:Skav206846  [mRNA]  locus=scaffold3577:31663:35798:+ [translate_table: standard]
MGSGLTLKNYERRTVTVYILEVLLSALQRVLNKNPVLAGRLRPSWVPGASRPEGLEISFDGPVGIHFQVRPLSADMEHQVERLDAERISSTLGALGT